MANRGILVSICHFPDSRNHYISEHCARSQRGSAARDEQRKTAINAIHYSLEEVYFVNNDAYPRTVSDEILPSVDPELFRDPNGVRIGDGASDYRYEATNCEADFCQAYTLRTILENEDDYVKTQR